MALAQRPSPIGKKVSLFVTCIVDMVYPQTGMSVVDILEHLGVRVDFPEAQTCCGQPGFNAGYREEAREVARQFLRAFKDAEVIVTPSGSCAAMVRHEYPTLFEDDPLYKLAAERAASITWEFTEFVVDGLGITDLHLRFPEPRTFTFHDACHGLRMLGLGKAGRILLEKAENARVIEMRDAETCCGFGGLFSVKMPDVSGAMLQKKMTCIRDSTADTVVTGDAGCLTHINGGLSRQQDEKRVQHIADVLASALPEEPDVKTSAPKATSL
ncbi:MAG: (Fe-S)-binding protein [bacterium]|nr:(Fe-S)-binding protein [bacterium]